MATHLLRGTGFSGAKGSLRLLTPEFLSGDGYAANHGIAGILAPAKILKGSASSTSTGAGTIAFRIPVTGEGYALSASAGQTGYEIEFEGEAYALSSGHLGRRFYPLEIPSFLDTSEASGTGAVVLSMPLTGAGYAAHGAEGGLGFAMPDLPDPTEFQVRGTINLVRNPSVEYDEIGLRDWSAGVGVAIARTDEDAWDGNFSVRGDVEVGVLDPEIVVVSQSGLGIDRDAAWVGSFAMHADLTRVVTTLRFLYTDATDEYGEWTEVVPDPEWHLVTTGSMRHDTARVLDRVDLIIATPQEVDPTTIFLDGAQIEEDRGENVTPYADGDQGEGHTWSGTPGFSPSVRNPQGVV
jgi:hypothetical protein